MAASQDNALELMQIFQKFYFDELNVEAVLELLDENVYWTGVRRQYYGKGKEETRRILEEEKNNRQAGFCVESSEYETEMLEEGIWFVRGRVYARTMDMGKPSVSRPLCIFAICAMTDLGIRFKMFHISVQEKSLERDTLDLIQKNKDLMALMQNLPGGVMCCESGKELSLIEYSEGFLSMFGYTSDDIINVFHNHFCEMIWPEDLEAATRSAREQLAKSNSKVIEYRVRHKDGRLIMVLDHGKLVERNGRNVFYCILSDVTESRKADNELRLSLERHKIIMEQTTDIIFEWDESTDRVLLPDKWEKKFGYKPYEENSVERAIEARHIHPADAVKVRQFSSDMLKAREPMETEVRLLKGDGTYIWCNIRATLQKNEQENRRKVIGVIIDIDKEKRRTQKLMERAEKDTLTGLYNKGATEQFSGEYLRQLNKEEKCALFIVDIDNFKFVNDVYGHLSGDVLLTEIARSLKGCFRKDDIIGRIGGDEFLILMKDIPGKKAVAAKAREVIKNISGLMKHEMHQVSCSMGIAFAPEDGKDFMILYRKADTALYYVKDRGKNGYKVYEPEMDGEAKEEARQLFDRGKAVIDSEQIARPGKTRIAEYVFHVLYSANDIRTAIGKVLEIIGKQFDVSRVYIFEDSEDGKVRNNTFEWCNQGIMPCIDERQNISYEGMEKYYDNFDGNGIYYCRNIDEMQEPERSWAREVDAMSVWQCVIRDNGRNRGYIGFNECKDAKYPTQEQLNVLDITAKIISIFLLKFGT